MEQEEDKASLGEPNASIKSASTTLSLPDTFCIGCKVSSRGDALNARSEFFPTERRQQQPPPTVWAYFSPSLHPRNSVATTTDGVVILAIGLLGVTLGVAGLAAYCVLQAPQLRAQLNIHPQRAFWRGGVPGIDGIFTPEEVLYGYEMGFVIAGVLFGIITNAMLVYGASKSLPPFFLPWLVFQVLFVAVVLAVTILVLVLAWPHRRKAFAVLPCTVAVIGVALWIKVHGHYQKLSRMKKPSGVVSWAYNPPPPTSMGYPLPAAHPHSCFSDHSLPKKLQRQDDDSPATESNICLSSSYT